MNANTDKIVEKIKKLLALADKAQNTNEHEAQAALLKAQKLMAEYGVSVEGNTEEAHTYKFVVCNTPGDKGFRSHLAVTIGDNFRCKPIMHGNQVAFLGRSEDVDICASAFEFAYKFAKRNGDREVRQARKDGRDPKNVFNSYAMGFLVGLRQKLAEQSKALMIVVPQDVKDEFSNRFTNTKRYAGGMRNDRERAYDHQAYFAGVTDGKNVLNERNEKLEA